MKTDLHARAGLPPGMVCVNHRGRQPFEPGFNCACHPARCAVDAVHAEDRRHEIHGFDRAAAISLARTLLAAARDLMT